MHKRRGSTELSEKLAYDSCNSILQVPKLPSFVIGQVPKLQTHLFLYYNLERRGNNSKTVVSLPDMTHQSLFHDISELV